MRGAVLAVLVLVTATAADARKPRCVRKMDDALVQAYATDGDAPIPVLALMKRPRSDRRLARLGLKRVGEERSRFAGGTLTRKQLDLLCRDHGLVKLNLWTQDAANATDGAAAGH